MSGNIAWMILLLVLASGCSRTATYGPFIVPESLEAGKAYTIEFDRSIASVEFTADDTLYLTATYVSGASALTARHRGRSTGATATRFRVSVPDDTEYIYFQVGLREDILNVEMISCMITDNGRPVEGALSHMIASATSLEEATELFNEDASLYPFSLDRYVAYWNGLARSGLSERIDMALPEGSPDAKDAFTYVFDKMALRAYGFLLRGLYDSTLATLSMLEQDPSAKTGPAAVKALRNLIQVLQPTQGGCVVPDDVTKELLAQVQRLAVRGSCLDAGLLTLLLRPLHRSVSASDAPLIQAATELLLTTDDHRLLAEMEMLRIVLGALSSLERWEDLRNLAESKLPLLNRSLLWYAAEDDPFVTMFPQYGMESVCRYLYASALLALKLYQDGLREIKSLLDRNYSSDYQYAMCSALKALARLPEHERPDISAGEIVSRSESLGCRKDSLIDLLAEGSGGADADAFRPVVSSYRTPISRVRTASGDIRIDVADDVYRLFLFTGKFCSICEIEYPGIIEAALRLLPSVAIFCVDVNGKDEENPYLLGNPAIAWVRDYREAVSAFRVRGVPSLRLLHNGEVILDGTTNAQGFSETLSKMLEKKRAEKDDTEMTQRSQR